MALPIDNEEDIENILNRSSAWAITYGDLMSTLMIFFLALFAFYSVSNKTGVTSASNPVMTNSEQKLGVNIVLKQPAFLPYDKKNINKSIDRALASARKELRAGTAAINIDGNIDASENREGLYNSNWISKVVFVVEKRDDSKYYVVKSGDTLWNITGKYLGNPGKYPVLAKLSDVKNPSLINIGDLIKVPFEKKVVVVAVSPEQPAKKTDSNLLSRVKDGLLSRFNKPNVKSTTEIKWL